MKPALLPSTCQNVSERETEREGERDRTRQPQKGGLDKYGRGPGVRKKEKVDTADMALLNILDKEILVQSRVDFKVTVKKSDSGRPLLLDGKLLNGDTVSGG